MTSRLYLNLTDETHSWIEQQADANGCKSPSDFLKQLIAKEQAKTQKPVSTPRFTPSEHRSDDDLSKGLIKALDRLQ